MHFVQKPLQLWSIRQHLAYFVINIYHVVSSYIHTSRPPQRRLTWLGRPHTTPRSDRSLGVGWDNPWGRRMEGGWVGPTSSPNRTSRPGFGTKAPCFSRSRPWSGKLKRKRNWCHAPANSTDVQKQMGCGSNVDAYNCRKYPINNSLIIASLKLSYLVFYKSNIRNPHILFQHLGNLAWLLCN